MSIRSQQGCRDVMAATQATALKPVINFGFGFRFRSRFGFSVQGAMWKRSAMEHWKRVMQRSGGGVIISSAGLTEIEIDIGIH